MSWNERKRQAGEYALDSAATSCAPEWRDYDWNYSLFLPEEYPSLEPKEKNQRIHQQYEKNPETVQEETKELNWNFILLFIFIITIVMSTLLSKI